MSAVVNVPLGSHIVRIKCPYPRCEGGYTLIVGFQSIDEQIKKLNDPKSCDKCGEFFKFHVRISVTSEPLP